MGACAGGGTTSTLLQNVEVLAADQRLDQTDEKAKGSRGLRSVTLLVTPDMAAKLTLAQSIGELHLTLRNDADQSIADTHPITMRELQMMQEAMFAATAADAAADDGDEEASNSAVTPVAPKNASLSILALRGNSSSVVRVTRPE